MHVVELAEMLYAPPRLRLDLALLLRNGLHLPLQRVQAGEHAVDGCEGLLRRLAAGQGRVGGCLEGTEYVRLLMFKRFLYALEILSGKLMREAEEGLFLEMVSMTAFMAAFLER